MSEQEFNALFARRLRRYLHINDMTQLDLAKKLGVSSQSVTNWVSGTKTPRMDKIDAMCAIFHCRRADLMTEDDPDGDDHYYLNPETRKAAQEIFENSDMRILFDAARDASPESLRLAAEMLRQMKGGRRDD